jgi:hypothetical protein
MHVGRSACHVTAHIIEQGWLHHPPTGSDFTYDTTVERFTHSTSCRTPFTHDANKINANMSACVAACEIHTPRGWVLEHVRCMGMLSACGYFHYFRGHCKLDNGRTHVVQVFVKLALVRYHLTPVLSTLAERADAELDKHIVPTGFLVKGQIQVMEYMPGDIVARGLIPEPHSTVRFALWLSTALLSILRRGGAYCDLKPENILRKRDNTGYCLCDVETIRSSDQYTFHVSTYPLNHAVVDTKGAAALRNMVYSFLVTVYSLWHVYEQPDTAAALSNAATVCKPLHFKELLIRGGNKTFDYHHHYFSALPATPKPQMLHDIEGGIIKFFAETDHAMHKATMEATIQLFESMEDYFKSMLDWLEIDTEPQPESMAYHPDAAQAMVLA